MVCVHDIEVRQARETELTKINRRTAVYQSTMLYTIGKLVWLGQRRKDPFPMPSYAEYLEDLDRPKDRRNAKQIISSVLSKMR